MSKFFIAIIVLILVMTIPIQGYCYSNIPAEKDFGPMTVNDDRPITDASANNSTSPITDPMLIKFINSEIVQIETVDGATLGIYNVVSLQSAWATNMKHLGNADKSISLEKIEGAIAANTIRTRTMNIKDYHPAVLYDSALQNRMAYSPSAIDPIDPKKGGTDAQITLFENTETHETFYQHPVTKELVKVRGLGESQIRSSTNIFMQGDSEFFRGEILAGKNLYVNVILGAILVICAIALVCNYGYLYHKGEL